jgi:hypothetical protein
MCIPGRISSIPGIPMLSAMVIPNLETHFDFTWIAEILARRAPLSGPVLDAEIGDLAFRLTAGAAK